MEEAEDSCLMNPSTLKQPLVRKQKIILQSISSKEAEDPFPVCPQRTVKEAEDSSLVDHTSTLLFTESIHTTSQRVHPYYSSVSFLSPCKS
nr:hypothetical protein CFP56_27337 [Quercus suber]